MTNETVKGFNDYTGEDAVKRAEIRKILIETFEKYGFEPVETPLIEYEEFVKGDNPNDEAVSDIFKLKDKGERKLALRYELTFQLKRLMNNKKLPYRRYQIGEVFRDEPVSSNRFRQFTQCDVDVIGSKIQDEVGIIVLASEVMEKLGVKKIMEINSRKLLNEILDEQKVAMENRDQIMRELDKLEKFGEKEVRANLKKYNAEKVLEIMNKPEAYFKKYNSYKDIEEIQKLCTLYKVKVKFNPSLARGLSYYNGIVYEIPAIAGGSYMFNGVQCTGISFGMERLCMISKIKVKKEKILILSINQDKEAIKLAQKLRAKGESVTIYYGKPSKALEYANAYEITKVIFVGEKEVKAKKFKIKDMVSGKESLLKI